MEEVKNKKIKMVAFIFLLLIISVIMILELVFLKLDFAGIIECIVLIIMDVFVLVCGFFPYKMVYIKNVIHSYFYRENAGNIDDTPSEMAVKGYFYGAIFATWILVILHIVFLYFNLK